jgi:hypothetical protein
MAVFGVPDKGYNVASFRVLCNYAIKSVPDPSQVFMGCRHISLLANPPPFTHNSPLNASGGFMFAIGSGNFQFGLMLATVLSFAMLPGASRAYTPEQEQACTNDAFRLCSADIPDVDRVTACMARNKSQLSPGCRAQFRPEPAAAVTPVVAGRPLVIKPASSRKKPVRAKARKPRKPARPAAT